MAETPPLKHLIARSRHLRPAVEPAETEAPETWRGAEDAAAEAPDPEAPPA